MSEIAPHRLTVLDRLRIERLVWSLDQRIYDLPWRTRINTRREVRANLKDAAGDVGAREAIRRLGHPAELAQQYLTAQFGDRPRPSYMAAALFFLTAQLIFTTVLDEAARAFAKGVAARDPHAVGTFTWSGIGYLQDSVRYTFTDGRYDFVGGAWTPLAWGLWIVSTICVGRLWRALPTWRRRNDRSLAETAAV